MAHYLVTGGCGFIGSHLSDALIAQGHQVRILDDLSTGKKENAPIAAEVIIGDATDENVVEAAFENIHGCFHLAAVASVQKSIQEWRRTHTVNATATVNVFQAASRQPRPVPVVYTSSAAVYGDNSIYPLSEDMPTIPLTAYGADKLSCDLHGRIAWLVHRIPNIGLRPFNVYGIRQDPSSPYSGVISIFTNRVRHNQPITIFGDGEQVRDFVHVSDVVKAFIGAMQHCKTGHDILNICTGKPTSINHLVSTIETLCGWRVQRIYEPARKGDIRISLGNPEKLQHLLGLQLSTSLEEGLTLTLDERKAAA